MHRLLFMIFSLFLFVLSDIIVYYKLKSEIGRKSVLYFFTALSLLAYVLIALVFLIGRKNFTHIWFPYYVLTYLILKYVPQLLLTVFIVIDFGVNLMSANVFRATDFNIGRRNFLLIAGSMLSAISGLYLLHGILRGRNLLTKNVVKMPTDIENLKGFRIVFFSDLHAGTLSKELINKLVDEINRLNADVVLFGGDWVNHFASELEPFVPDLARIKSKYGKFSCWGNHDYAMYYPWYSEQERLGNFKRLKELLQDSGFTILENQGIIINHNGVKVGIAGTEYWGRALRTKYGRLAQAYEKIKDADYKILLTHDPDHFTEHIVHRLDKYPLDLVLSGHTHGFQMGIQFKGYAFSPAQFMYKHWKGLYAVNNTYHFVTVGVGSIGYLGRAGIYPEIAIIELT